MVKRRGCKLKILSCYGSSEEGSIKYSSDSKSSGWLVGGEFLVFFPPQDNASLELLPSEEEVRQVVFGMDGESAAGPDGFTGLFFTSCWDIVGQDVVKAVQDFFVGADLPQGLAFQARETHFRTPSLGFLAA